MTHCIRTAAIAAALGGIFLVGQVNAQTLPQAQLRLGLQQVVEETVFQRLRVALPCHTDVQRADDPTAARK